MYKILAVMALCGTCLYAGVTMAKHHEYKDTPQYQQMENNTRESLKSCLNNENVKTHECIEKYKDTRKMQKKEIKRAYKNKDSK